MHDTLLTDSERAKLMNTVNKALEGTGLEVCGYEDTNGFIFKLLIWKAREGGSIVHG